MNKLFKPTKKHYICAGKIDMKVLYDHQIFSAQKYGGISRYFYELMNRFSKMCGIHYDLALKYSRNYYILSNPGLFNVLEDTKTDRFCYGIQFRGKAKIFDLLGRLSVLDNPSINNLKNTVDILNKSDFDVFHPTYYDDYFLNNLKRKPFVLTVHDMIHEIYSDRLFSKSNSIVSKKRELMHKASRIIAVSENTKKDIIKICGVDKNKISVVYHGNSLNPDGSKNVDLPVPDNYILYVGDRHAYKNFVFFVTSIKPLLLRHKELFLICAGSVNLSLKEKRFLAQHGLADKVVHLPITRDDQLAYLYGRALCFVFPTLYEGFGIPVLEAFACGSPAVLSKTSSLPEVGGDAALYFDPADADSIHETIKKVIYDSNLANSLKEKGYEQLKKFSWEKCASDTFEVYSSVI